MWRVQAALMEFFRWWPFQLPVRRRTCRRALTFVEALFAVVHHPNPCRSCQTCCSFSFRGRCLLQVCCAPLLAAASATIFSSPRAWIGFPTPAHRRSCTLLAVTMNSTSASLRCYLASNEASIPTRQPHSILKSDYTSGTILLMLHLCRRTRRRS